MKVKTLHTVKRELISVVGAMLWETYSIYTVWDRNTRWEISCGDAKKKSTWKCRLRMFYAYLSTTILGLIRTRLSLRTALLGWPLRNPRSSIRLPWILQRAKKNKKFRTTRINFQSIPQPPRKQKKYWYHRFTKAIKYRHSRVRYLPLRNLYRSRFCKTWKLCSLESSQTCYYFHRAIHLRIQI